MKLTLPPLTGLTFSFVIFSSPGVAVVVVFAPALRFPKEDLFPPNFLGLLFPSEVDASVVDAWDVVFLLPSLPLYRPLPKSEPSVEGAGVVVVVVVVVVVGAGVVVVVVVVVVGKGVVVVDVSKKNQK